MIHRHRVICSTLAALALLGLSCMGPRTPVQATTITPRAALVRVLTARHVSASWFAPSFLSHVSIAQVQAGVDGLKSTFGPYVSVSARPDGSFLVTFQRGTALAQIHLDAQGRIDGLLLTQPRFSYLSEAAALQELRALPGHVSLLVTANGATRRSLNPDRLLGVGSAFKLAVLTALQQRIKAGQLTWTQQVTLRAQDKSLPSGVLQTRPNGSRYTVSELARYMISLSDNTAADLLIHLVGKAAIDPLIPASDRPILTTHEFFVLKDPAHRALRDRYLAASPARRPAILAEADRLPLPALSTIEPLFAKGPVSPQIEWFFSVRQLCGLMGRVQKLPQMSVNPGVADSTEWRHVAYKGGSEPGVLNLTTMVTSHQGTTYCIAATWNNDTSLDEARFERMYSSLLHALSA